MLHPDGVGESKSNNSLYIKAEVFFTLILGVKLSMSLLCSFTASRRFQTSSKTNWVLPPPISHCQEQHHNTHKAQQYGTHLYSSQCKYCYLPEVTQELCERNEVSLFSGAAVVPLPPCQWVTNSSTKRFYCFGCPLLSEPLQARLFLLWAPQTCRSSPQWHSGQTNGCSTFCPQRGTSCLRSFQ